jgi:DNA topoisomerase-3
MLYFHEHRHPPFCIFQVDGEKFGKVVDVSDKEEKRAKPQALNTVSLLKMASSILGIGPQQAMHIAERLYLSGYITYPRTETSKYPGMSTCTNFAFAMR